MSKMIQIRHVPDALHRRLRARAAMAGMSLSDYLRGAPLLTCDARIAAAPSLRAPIELIQ